MPLFKRLAMLATAAEAARRYARSNPDKASKYLDQAAQFVDKQTKGKYSGQIRGATSKVKNVAGIHPTHGPGNPRGAGGNGYPQSYDQGGFGPAAGQQTPPPPPSGQPGQPGQPGNPGPQR